MSTTTSIVSKIIDISIVIGIIALIAVSSREAVKTPSRQQTLLVDEYVLALFPTAASLTAMDTSIVKVYDNDGVMIGYLLKTSPYADHVDGFADSTPLLIGLDSEETVVGTVLLPNSETGSYIRRITREGFLDSWNGYSAREALDKKVDAISGATLSSNAVVKSFQIRMAIYHDSPFSERMKITRIIQDIFAVILIIWALLAFFNPQKIKKSRIILLVLSICILGFSHGKILSLATFLAWITNGVPSPVHWVMILLVMLSFLLPFIFGKHFYCTWLCPFGAVQELVGKLKKKKLKLPKQFYEIRKYYLISIIFVPLIGAIADLASFEPFSALLLKSTSASSLILAGVFTILSVFINKPWCRIFCPTGQLLEFVRSISLKNLKMKNNEE